MHSLNHVTLARTLQQDRERELEHARLVAEVKPPRRSRIGALLRRVSARVTFTPLPRDRR